MSVKSQILAHLCRINLPDAPAPFLDVLTSSAESALGKTRIEAEEFAVATSARYWADVLVQVEADRRLGLIPFCEIVHRDHRLLRNPSTSYLQSTANRAKWTGSLLRSRPPLLSKIDLLSDREYEAIGCFACRLIGAQRDLLTPSNNEGGIDFLASVRLHSPCHVFSSIGREVRIVGQSKKYASKVPVGTVDQFIKTVENVRHRSDRVDPVLPAWFHASSGSIIGWMVAHSGFQTGAQDEAKKHGIVLSDSRDLAEIISLSRKFHGSAHVNDRVAHLPTDVASLLTEFPD